MKLKTIIIRKETQSLLWFIDKCIKDSTEEGLVKMETSASRKKELAGLQYIEGFADDRCYLAAWLSVNISSTLFGIKPATLLNLSARKSRNLIQIWDRYKQEIFFGQNIKFIELKRSPNNLIVMFYNHRNLSRQIFSCKHLRFLERFGYTKNMFLDDMLKHLQERYCYSCPHEIGLFLGIPLKDVLGYLNLVPLECSYCGYWKVYGNHEKTKRLFECYRIARQKVICLVCSGEDPLRILDKPSAYRSVLRERDNQPLAV